MKSRSSNVRSVICDSSAWTIPNAAKSRFYLRGEVGATAVENFAGLTAYIKKPEYGPADIIAENVSIDATETPVLVQTDSRISLDGIDYFAGAVAINKELSLYLASPNDFIYFQF